MRSEIVAEAMSWIGTPWHHEARIKGAGVDCGQFLIGVYSAVGLMPPIATEHYPQDWHMNRARPRFLELLLQYADPVDEPLPGDVAMFQYGRHPAHGSIVVDWPTIVHAWKDEGGVVLTDVEHSKIKGRFAGFYRMKGLE